jgi:uncharacterized protein
LSKLEHGIVQLDTKDVGEDGTFHGYASLFGVTDLGRDSVTKGAFTKSLKQRPAARIKMLREHIQSEPIGVWTSITEDATGLAVSGKLVLDTVKGRETHALLKAGALDGLSIGYRTKTSRLDRAKGTRVLDEVELHEISIVTFPMLTQATVTAVKHNGTTQFRALVDAINSARKSIH